MVVGELAAGGDLASAAETRGAANARQGRRQDQDKMSSARATSHRRHPGAGAGDDLTALFTRWQRDHDGVARDELVRHYMPLARSLARRYTRSSEPFEDLVQVASLGLLKALDRFDPTRGHPFASFAVPTILGEMRRYFRDAGWALHIPRGVQECALKVRDAQERFANEQGHAPTVNQLAQYLELSSEEIVDALQAIQAYETVSLDAPPPGSGDDVTSYRDATGQEDERYELVELDATVAAVLEHIPVRERLILRLRFVDDLTQTEIAARVGISQMQVSRLLRRSLEQLRTLAQASREVL
jgi:RNA polymerase sigma-B factor